MAGAFGTLTTLDTLATTQQTVTQFGEDNAWVAIEASLAAHNGILREQLGMFATFTSDKLRRYGGPANMEMEEVDEYGTASAQKLTAGSNVGFPMRLYEIGVQWTRKYFQNALASELAAQFIGVEDADSRRMQRSLKQAIFKPTNLSFEDRLTDHVILPVKALINADSAPIPIGPNGEVFNAATHTHYLATAAFVAADLNAVIDTVVEHFGVGTPIVMINKAQEVAVRGFTGFVGYLDPRVIGANNVNQARGTLDMINVNNRAIGVFGAAEVWVKPWIPANYVVVLMTGISAKPLAFRTRTGSDTGGDLTLEFEDEVHPLRARVFSREYGISVWNRHAAAVLYTGGGAYVEPVLT